MRPLPQPAPVFAAFAFAASIAASPGCYLSTDLDAIDLDGGEGGSPRRDATVPGRDGSVVPGDDAGGDDPDAGSLRRDGGPFPFDAGLPLFDAGRPPFDAGLPPFDAGLPPLDASRLDASVVPVDAGPPRDGGVVPIDAAPPADAGRPDSGRPIDAGPIDAGRRSVALGFDPVRYLQVPDRPSLAVGPASTIELWVRARGPGIVSRKGQDAGQQHFTIRLEGEGDATEIVAGWVNVRLEERLVRAPFGAHLGTWTHVALVVSPSGPDRTVEARLYVDFELVASATVPDDFGSTYNLEPLLFGRFDGDLDEIRIWSSARAPEALRANALVRLPIGTAGMVAYWPLEEAPAGQIALDRALRGNDAILGRLTSSDDLDPTWITDGPIP